MAPGLEINAVRIAQARLAMPKENGRPVSQAKFAEKLGIHWVTVSNLERGKTKPSGETLAAICRVTGKPVEWFTGAAQEVQAPGADPFRPGVDGDARPRARAGGRADTVAGAGGHRRDMNPKEVA
jgi:DNA-binding XRE family transcriptional regulator